MVPKAGPELPSDFVPDVLIASDDPSLRHEIRSVLPVDATVREVSKGADVLPAVRERAPDLAILDLQMGNMGAMAVSLDLRLEEGAGRLPHVRLLMLVDRRADVFLARRSQTEGWLVKPLDSIRLRRAIRAVLEGGTYYDDAFRPVTIPAAADGSATGLG